MRRSFFLYVVVELLAFILLGKWLGFGWTILLYLGLFILGVAIAAWQMRVLTVRVLRDRRSPGKLTGDAALSAFGALLVALPGVVTGVVGILFMLPPTRSLARRSMGTALRAKVTRLGGESFIVSSRASDPQVRNIPGWGEVIDHRSEEFGDEGPAGTTSAR